MIQNENLRKNLTLTQTVINDYIEYKKDSKNFTKYLEDKNERTDKKDSKIVIAKK